MERLLFCFVLIFSIANCTSSFDPKGSRRKPSRLASKKPRKKPKSRSLPSVTMPESKSESESKSEAIHTTESELVKQKDMPPAVSLEHREYIKPSSLPTNPYLQQTLNIFRSCYTSESLMKYKEWSLYIFRLANDKTDQIRNISHAELYWNGKNIDGHITTCRFAPCTPGTPAKIDFSKKCNNWDIDSVNSEDVRTGKIERILIGSISKICNW